MGLNKKPMIRFFTADEELLPMQVRIRDNSKVGLNREDEHIIQKVLSTCTKYDAMFETIQQCRNFFNKHGNLLNVIAKGLTYEKWSVLPKEDCSDADFLKL